MTTVTTQTVQPEVAKQSRRKVLAAVLAVAVVTSVVVGAVIFGRGGGDSGAGTSAPNAQSAGQPAPVAVPLPRLVR